MKRKGVVPFCGATPFALILPENCVTIEANDDIK
jgi:hypothetical protein